MEHRGADAAWPVAQHSRFELAPPRRFLLPALLLLLSEEPGYGYNLAKGLEDLRFGRVDRPSVYRALAQLERDGLVESWAGTPKAGQARRVYGLTEEGQRASCGLDGRHQAGAGLPGPGAAPLRRHRDGRRRAGRGRGRLGRGDRPSVVPGVGDVAHRAAPPRQPARRSGPAPARGAVQRAGRAGCRRPVPERVDPRPVRRRARSLGDPDRGPLDRGTHHLRRGRGDRGASTPRSTTDGAQPGRGAVRATWRSR